MSEMNTPMNPEWPVRRRVPTKAQRKAKTTRLVLRGTMMFLTILLMVLVAALSLLDGVFNGPSVAARDILTRSLSYSSGTYWIPAMFLGDELAAEIIAGDPNDGSIPDSSLDAVIDTTGALNGDSEEWANSPDGIRIETVKGSTYTAHVMIVRDPSTVYVGTSTESFSPSIAGGRLNQVIERENAIAGINGGAFYDDGSSGTRVGATPYGLVVSKGDYLWDDGRSGPADKNWTGFVGFTEDNLMIVSKTVTAAQAKEWKIRDGVCFGPVLIINSQINNEAYNNDGGWNPRTGIGQRADGAVVMVCIDGRQAGSIGGSFADLIDIMVEYGVVNACALDGGTSTIMYYRDTYGLYGEAGKLKMINTYSALQEEPRRMPTFFLVRAANEE